MAPTAELGSITDQLWSWSCPHNTDDILPLDLLAEETAGLGTLSDQDYDEAELLMQRLLIEDGHVNSQTSGWHSNSRAIRDSGRGTTSKMTSKECSSQCEPSGDWSYSYDTVDGQLYITPPWQHCHSASHGATHAGSRSAAMRRKQQGAFQSCGGGISTNAELCGLSYGATYPHQPAPVRQTGFTVHGSGCAPPTEHEASLHTGIAERTTYQPPCSASLPQQLAADFHSHQYQRSADLADFHPACTRTSPAVSHAYQQVNPLPCHALDGSSGVPANQSLMIGRAHHSASLKERQREQRPHCPEYTMSIQQQQAVPLFMSANHYGSAASSTAGSSHSGRGSATANHGGPPDRAPKQLLQPMQKVDVHRWLQVNYM